MNLSYQRDDSGGNTRFFLRAEAKANMAFYFTNI